MKFKKRYHKQFNRFALASPKVYIFDVEKNIKIGEYSDVKTAIEIAQELNKSLERDKYTVIL